MIASLIQKEFKSSSFALKLKKDNILNTIIELVLYAGFIAIEIYLFNMLSKKLNIYENAPQAFLAIFLALVNIALIGITTVSTRKVFFNEEDSMIMITRPVRSVDNIISKIIFIYARTVGLNYIVSFPILISYASNMNMPYYIYIISALYPLVIALAQAGFAALLSLPAQKIYLFLKRFPIAQIILSLIVIGAFCVLYSYVLNIFMIIVENGDINKIFTTESVATMQYIGKFLFITRFFVPIFSAKYLWLLLFAFICIALMAIGVAACSAYYIKFIKNEREGYRNYAGSIKEPKSLNSALLYKEFKLIFASNSTISFSTLLIMEPILTYIIVKAINLIFKSGVFTFVSSMFEYFNPVMDMMLVVLFAVIVNTSSSFVLSREGYNGIKICKTIPVSYSKQLLIKMVVPFVCSILALLLSVVILVAFKEMAIITGVLTFIIAIVLSLILELVSVTCDLYAPTTEKGSAGRAIVEIIAILLPVIFVGVIAILCYKGMQFIPAYFISFGVLVVILGAYLAIFILKISKKFALLEIRN